jgi:hypothetical protein
VVALTSCDSSQAWRDSLVAMKNSIKSSYELGTAVKEQKRFLEAWDPSKFEYTVFSDYRRNEGLRRIEDVTDVIDTALKKLESCDSLSASALYLDTLRTVAMFTKWARFLEDSYYDPDF